MQKLPSVSPLLAFLLLSGAPLTTKAQSLIPAETIQLKNGMTAVLHVDRRQPSVAVLLYYRIGARHEVAGRTGLAHLFEHLQFHGSQHMLPYHPRWYLQKSGARESNGATTFDRTLYYEVVPSVNLEPILWMESDRMGFPSLKALDLDDERKIVKNERRQRFEITPYGAARELVWKRLFPIGHPYYGMVIGDQTDLDKLTLDEAMAFFRKYYDPSNATLVLAGDFDPEQVRPLITKYFESLKSHDKPVSVGTPKPVIPAVPVGIEKEVQLQHEEKIGVRPRLIMSWLSPPRCTPQDEATNVLAMILSRGPRGRLDRLKVQTPEQDLSFSVGQESLMLQSVFSIEVEAKEQTALTLAKAQLDRQLAEIAEKGVAAEELGVAKKWLLNQEISALQSVLTKAHRLAYSVECYDSVSAVGRSMEYIGRVTSEDLQQLVKRFFVPQKRVSVYAVPVAKESKK